MRLILPASLCLASFGWGMVWHFRRTGRPTPFMMVVAMAALISASLQVAALLNRPAWHGGTALILYVTGGALFWWAVAVTRGKLAACGQGYVSPGIVAEGPYHWIRHPFYTAYNLCWIAGFVASGWWPLLVSAVVMALFYDLSAREEERGFMDGPLSGEYRAYRQRSGRYFPVRFRAKSSPSGRSGF